MERKQTRKSLYLILAVILCSVAMTLVDGVLQPPYMVKSAIKVVLFLLVPAIYFISNREERIALKGILVPNRKSLLIALGLGVVLYGIIVGGYFLLRNSFDFSGIAGKLTADTGVSAENFLWVSLYISLVNSFLEELFFRGFGFLLLGRVGSQKLAFVFSALMFALYHSCMTLGYYHFGIFALILFALFVAGCFFNALGAKSKSIYPSWFVHMFANFGINTVGFILFGVI